MYMKNDQTFHPDTTMRGDAMSHQPMMEQSMSAPQAEEPAVSQFPEMQSMAQGAVAQQEIGSRECPYCGAIMDEDADFCETCHRYIRKDVCSFCGTLVASDEAYCPECGSPRGGVVCPMWHTINDFSFCKQCGTPLTDDARMLVATLQKNPDYQELMLLSNELMELDKCVPVTTAEDKARENYNEQLRERLVSVLKKDGESIVPDNSRSRSTMSAEELLKKKSDRMNLLSQLLDKFAIKATQSPAIARNYAMASKPQGVQLAWVCNYKHAMHSSPCGCAKPQLGGKWIILGKGGTNQLKDDHDDK